jgi:sigma-B regulation protein RsbU (phosphoserine phosphatase)
MNSQENLLLAMTGSAIFTVGVLSLCAHFGSALSRERILLWFGLFASPYGIALICRSILLPEWDGRAELLVVILGRLIGLLASIPALLLFREFYGAGWRLSTKWLIGIYALSVLAVFCLMALNERPRSIPSPGIALVILVPLELLVDRLAGYRPPPIAGRPIIFVGLLFFFLTFSYDHLAHWRTGTVRATTEPFGFLALLVCLGYVVFRRVSANEAEWLSLTDEMRAARKIQTAILPSSMPAVAGFSVAARYAPMTGVAGDFYGFPRADPGWMATVVADVMGHGVPAALVASMVKVSVFAGAEAREKPGEIIQGLNRTICKEAPSQLVTAVYVSMNRSTGSGRYSAAGHPPPLLWRMAAQKLDALDAAGLLLGVRSEEHFSEGDFQFETGDRLLIYSDGLTEAENKAGLSFGDTQLPSLLKEAQSLPAEELASQLLDKVLKWTARGSKRNQEDDITFVVIDLV